MHLTPHLSTIWAVLRSPTRFCSPAAADSIGAVFGLFAYVIKGPENGVSHLFLLVFKSSLVLLLILFVVTASQANSQNSDQSSIQIQLHSSRGPHKRARKTVVRDRADLPAFDDPFGKPVASTASESYKQDSADAEPVPVPVPHVRPIHTSSVYPTDGPRPLKEAQNPRPRLPEPVPPISYAASNADSVRLEKTIARERPISKNEVRPMGWIDYSAMGVFTQSSNSTYAGAVSSSPESRLLEQTLTFGGGLDLLNTIHLSFVTHLQYTDARPLSSSEATPTPINPSANTTPPATGAYLNDLYAHAISKFDLIELLGTGESLKFDVGALAPFAPDAKAEGYQAVYLGSASLFSRAIPARLTIQNSLSANYIWNRFEFSTVSGRAHQEGGAGYRLATLWRLAPDFEFTIGGGVKVSPSFDGSQATNFNGSANVAYRIENWLLHLGYSVGSFQEMSEQNLWFIDQPQQVVSGGLGLRF